MKKSLLAVLIAFAFLSAKSQNTFPSSGNVGIGTISPASLLHVFNSASPANTIGSTSEVSNFAGTSGGNILQMKFLYYRHTLNGDWTSISSRLQAVTDVTSQGYLEFNPQGEPYGLAIGTGSTELMRFKLNGNVGIGTSSPSFKLDINSADNDGATRLRIANTSSTGINAAGSFPTLEILGARGDGNSTFEGRLALGTRRTDGTSLSNQSLGAILFGGQYGTDNSFEQSKVLYPSSIQGVAEGSFSNSTAMPTAIIFNTSSTGNDVGATNFSYGTERMRITSSGNVGIGTTAPTSLLDVRGDIYTNANMIVDGGDVIINRTSNAFGYVVRPNIAGYKKLQFAVAGGGPLEDLYLNSDNSYFTGNVGIGTASPGPYKLAVEGTIGARKIKVTQANPWADYVFDNNYRLPDLSEVEKYILLHKHLPDVPSAKEVQQNGIDLGDNQVVLLKKIEELTLYVIEQNKRIKKLEEEVKHFKKK